MSIMALPPEGGKDWLVMVNLKAKDGTSVVHDLKKAGLPVSYET
ncbi:MAG: hypothetical protein P8075_07735 [Deltaproteobacteria bacterium]|jgi:hypothetical protein